ncbi:MAG: hypothetical protein ACFFCI_02410 [Promethearchaeota archaeon]
MTIRFDYLFNSFEYILVLVLYSTYFILFNVFILLSSKEQKREYKEFSYLKITSIINIILGGLIFFIPGISIITPAPQFEISIYVAFLIFRSLFFFIPRIFTMGLIFVLIGRKYKEKIGRFFMYSGIFWTIYSTWASICLYTPELAIPNLPPLLEFLGILDFPVAFILQPILGIGSISNIIAYIFFMIHSYYNNDRNLKIAGFIYIIGPSLMVLGMIPYYLSIWY